MRLFRAGVMLCVLGAIAADDPKKGDAEKFKGEWKASSMKQGGVVVGAEFIKGLKISFDGKSYVNTVGDQVEEGDYTIDPSQTPKTIDLDIKKGNDAGKKQLGIYKFEDGKLIIVVTEAGSKERPKSFTSKEGDDVIEFVFEHEKA